MPKRGRMRGATSDRGRVQRGPEGRDGVVEGGGRVVRPHDEAFGELLGRGLSDGEIRLGAGGRRVAAGEEAVMQPAVPGRRSVIEHCLAGEMGDRLRWRFWPRNEACWPDPSKVNLEPMKRAPTDSSFVKMQRLTFGVLVVMAGEKTSAT